MIGLIALAIVPRETRAEEKAIEFKMQVPLPNSETFGTDSSGKEKNVVISGNTIGNYIVDIYKYAIGIVGILASIILMYGGVLWITAMGSAERISEAQSWIKAAITGTVLALSSYMILYIVNPDLVKFNALNINDIETVGCCNDSESITKEACDGKKGSWKEGSCSTNSNGCCENACGETNESSCKTAKGIWINNTSVNVYKCDSSTKKCEPINIDSCEKKSDGTPCGEGYCYNNKCLTGKGSKGESCGDNGGSTCVDTAMGLCTNGLDGGGRDCDTGLYCCD